MYIAYPRTSAYRLPYLWTDDSLLFARKFDPLKFNARDFKALLHNDLIFYLRPHRCSDLFCYTTPGPPYRTTLLARPSPTVRQRNDGPTKLLGPWPRRLHTRHRGPHFRLHRHCMSLMARRRQAVANPLPVVQLQHLSSTLRSSRCPTDEGSSRLSWTARAVHVQTGYRFGHRIILRS